ncbi:MAG: hypothetical protein ACLP5H_34255 [Desulfomonilaceae bacterium]
MWLKSSLWPDTTKQCSGEGQDILVDGGALGEVCSKSGKWGLFINITAVLSLSGLMGGDKASVSGFREPSLAPLSSRRPQNGKTAA